MRLIRFVRRALVALCGDDYRPFDGHPSLSIWDGDLTVYPSTSALVRPLSAAGEPLAWAEVRP